MKFYLDENLSPEIAEIARGRCGLDVVSVQEAGTRGWSDEAQLRFAAEAGRCMVTHNRPHFYAATNPALAAGSPHAGVLILTRSLPNARFAAIAEALCAFNRQRPDGLAPYEIQFLVPA